MRSVAFASQRQIESIVAGKFYICLGTRAPERSNGGPKARSQQIIVRSAASVSQRQLECIFAKQGLHQLQATDGSQGEAFATRQQVDGKHRHKEDSVSILGFRFLKDARLEQRMRLNRCGTHAARSAANAFQNQPESIGCVLEPRFS